MTEAVVQQPSVLVVDDNPLILNTVKSLLQASSYHVITSENGREALGVLESKSVDVIISDVMMPNMGGYELHEALRGRPEYAHIPFIFLTALSEPEEIRKGREVGADDYLVKPFSPQELLSTVKGKVQRSIHLKNIAAQHLDKYRKKVIHTLSHEFRTPLVAVNTGAELLLDQGEAMSAKRVRTLLEAIQRGGQRLERLVSDFMILQQIEAGIAERMFSQYAKVVRISELVATLLESRTSWFKEEQAVVSMVDNVEGSLVRVYEPHIYDILARLLANSIKFSPDKKCIDVVLQPQSAELVVEVRDRGSGIDTSRIHEAVDLFGQLDRERLEQQGGGLGLAIASRYAALNRGRLEFDRRPGGGSIVSLVLPVAAPVRDDG